MADSIYSWIGKWLANTIWPWVRKNLWPVIQKAIVHIFVLILQNLVQKVFSYFKERKATQAEEALKKAAEAEARARNAESDIEAEKHRAVANVWRQVADDFTKEDKNLLDKLYSFANDAAEDFEHQVEGLKSDKAFDNTIQERIAESPPPSLPPNLNDSEGKTVSH